MRFINKKVITFLKSRLMGVLFTVGVFASTGAFAELRETGGTIGSKFDTTYIAHAFSKKEGKDWTYEAVFEDGAVSFFFKDSSPSISSTNIPYRMEFLSFSNGKTYTTKDISFEVTRDYKAFGALYNRPVEVGGVKYSSLTVYMSEKDGTITPTYNLWL
jgi:hypothetical protein